MIVIPIVRIDWSRSSLPHFESQHTAILAEVHFEVKLLECSRVTVSLLMIALLVFREQSRVAVD
jgi:hypothetical protein